eukprot:TRINITY_DN3003_c0_g1_i8.p2 TRINITY_DN3003_c0_g1~~TRINITY_DN3003_c0_g1_i8.p2  ORF type:complete len:243 (-),score=15.36 TRINITY_DN3003_c0_g1_i8:1454-2182(-)
MGSLHQVPRKPCQGNHQRGSLVGGGLKSSGPMSFMNKKKTYELVQSRALSAEGLTQVELDSIQSESLNKVEEVQQKSDLAYLKNLETISADIEEKKEIMQLPKLQKDNSAQLQIIDSCRGELQQYKQLRAEVKPWIESFTKENGRQPTIVDVVNTTDVSFQSVYKSYMLLRDKLFTEIPQLRPKLDPNNQTEEPVKKNGRTRKRYQLQFGRLGLKSSGLSISVSFGVQVKTQQGCFERKLGR